MNNYFGNPVSQPTSFGSSFGTSSFGAGGALGATTQAVQQQGRTVTIITTPGGQQTIHVMEGEVLSSVIGRSRFAGAYNPSETSYSYNGNVAGGGSVALDPNQPIPNNVTRVVYNRVIKGNSVNPMTFQALVANKDGLALTSETAIAFLKQQINVQRSRIAAAQAQFNASNDTVRQQAEARANALQAHIALLKEEKALADVAADSRYGAAITNAAVTGGIDAFTQAFEARVAVANPYDVKIAKIEEEIEMLKQQRSSAYVQAEAQLAAANEGLVKRIAEAKRLFPDQDFETVETTEGTTEG